MSRLSSDSSNSECTRVEDVIDWCSVKPTTRLVYHHRRSISPDPSDVIFVQEVMIKKLEDIPGFILKEGREGRSRFQILCFTQKMQSRP